MHRDGNAALALSILIGLMGPIMDRCRADDANTKECRLYAITKWDAGCDGDRRDAWDDMVLAWFNEIRNNAPLPDGHGAAAYSSSSLNVDGVIVDSDFVDPALQAWGNDTNGADQPDVFMVALHGGNDSDDHRWHGKVRVNEVGGGSCYAYQGDIKLGDDDLEFLHLSSCYSMDREDWWNEWNSTFDGLHQVDGFHGIMWIDPEWTRRYRHFAEDSFWMGMGDSWLDHLYYTHWLLGNRDQCPVARVVGTDANDSRSRMDNERYTNVLSDPPGVGQDRHHRVRYIRGCNPRGKGALPE